MITMQKGSFKYSTQQTSNDSTIDVYWNIVNDRYINIVTKQPYAYDIDWINGAIHDAICAIDICNIVLRGTTNKLVANYKDSFLLIIRHLTAIKEEIAKAL